MSLSWERFLIQSNFVGVLLFVGMIAFVLTNRSFSKKLSRPFILATIFSFLLLISDNFRNYTAMLSEPCFMRYLSASLGYTLRPLIVYLLVVISGRYFKQKVRLLNIPWIVNGVVSFINLIPSVQGLMYYFDEANVFHRGVLGLLPYVASIIYVVLIIYYSIKIVNVNRLETIAVIIFIIFVAIATYFESVAKCDLILAPTIGLAIVFYYMFLNIQLYKRDQLTQLLNRRVFYLDIRSLKNKSFVLISMDMNNLKQINDTYGHQIGDEALKTVVNVMQRTFKRNAVLYRVGGDEFVAIFKNTSENVVKELVRQYQKNLEKTDYQVACGVVAFSPEDNVVDKLAFADEEMYKNKQILKNGK